MLIQASIIVTLISLIYIVLSYFGIFRYIYCLLSSPSKYVHNYMSMDKGSENRVIISMYATQDDLEHIQPVINSLLSQSVRVDEIALNVNTDCKVPKSISDYINIHKCNHKCIDNIRPTLIREKDENTIIIPIKLGVVYGENMIGDMLDSFHGDNIVISGDNNVKLIQTKFFNTDFIDDCGQSIAEYIQSKSIPVTQVKLKDNYNI